MADRIFEPLSETVESAGDSVPRLRERIRILEQELGELNGRWAAMRVRLEFESFLSNLSATFVGLSSGELEAGIRRGLQQIAEFLNLDFGLVLLFAGEQSSRCQHSFFAAGRTSFAAPESVWSLPWLGERVRRGAMILLQGIQDLPAEAVAEKKFFQQQALHSLAAIPLATGGRIQGLLVFGTLGGERSWSGAEVVQLRHAGELVANALERQHVEAALGQSEARYRAIVEDQGEFIVRWDLQGARSFVNEAFCRYLGRSREELLAESHWTLVDPGQQAALREQLLKLGPELPALTREQAGRLSGGRPVWQHWTDRAIFDGRGILVEFQSVGRDITAQKNVEDALRASEERLRAVVEHMPVMMGAFDERQRVLAWNRESERVTGYSAREILQHPEPLKLLYPDEAYRTQVLRRWREKTEVGDIRNAENTITRKDGTVRTLSWSNISQRVPIPGWANWGIGVDVTERKATEEALRESRHFIERIAEASPNFIYVFNIHSSQVLYRSRPLVQDLGHDPAEEERLEGGLFEALLHPDDRKVRAEQLARWAGAQDGQLLEFEFRLRHSNGTWRWFISRSMVFARDAGGAVTQIVGTVEDVHERKTAESERDRLALELQRRLEEENAYLRQQLQSSLPHDAIVGKSVPIQQVLQRIELVAPTDATVLIRGETGTGKELVARAIHERSGRKGMPFIKVSCGAIPKELFESEFFGHARGAFTGAIQDRIGRFELADGGTLLLDEVGEIPLELQSKLLRVLQEGTFERVGESRTRSVNVRVIAATHRNLKEQQTFREDLYYRLNVFPVEVPPLRERADDIPLLAEHFLRQAAQRFNLRLRPLTPDQVEQLKRLPWPGNIRELQNVIERAVIVSRGQPLSFEAESAPLPNPLPAAPPGPFGPPARPVAESGLLREGDLKDLQRQRILTALEKTNWRIYGAHGAAELLGLKPTTLASRIKRLGLVRGRAGPAAVAAEKAPNSVQE